MTRTLLLFLLTIWLALPQRGDAQIVPHVQIDARRILWGDIVYLQASLENAGNEAVVLPTAFSSPIGNLGLQVRREGVEKPFPLPPPYFAAIHMTYRQLDPRQRRQVGGEVFCLPPLPSRDSSFWSEARQGDAVDLITTFRHAAIAPENSVTQQLEIVPRQPAEQQWLEQLLDAADARERNPVGQIAPHVGAIFAPIGALNRYLTPDRRIIDELIAHEDRLSSGTLKNMTHVLGLLQVVADQPNVAAAARMAAAKRLFADLDDLPPVERAFLTREVRKFATEGLKFSTPANPDAPAEALKTEIDQRIPQDE